MGVRNILGQDITWKRCLPNRLGPVHNKGMPMQLRSKEPKSLEDEEHHCYCNDEYCQACTSDTPCELHHGFYCCNICDKCFHATWLGNPWGSSQIICMESKIYLTSKCHWIHSCKKTCSCGIASDAGTSKCVKTQQYSLGWLDSGRGGISVSWGWSRLYHTQQRRAGSDRQTCGSATSCYQSWSPSSNLGV